MKKINSFLKTISNFNRLKIIYCLKNGNKNVKTLIKYCRLSQSATSQHLIKLKKMGLVNNYKKGRTIFYQLKDKKIAFIAEKILKYLKVELKNNKNKI